MSRNVGRARATAGGGARGWTYVPCVDRPTCTVQKGPKSVGPKSMTLAGPTCVLGWGVGVFLIFLVGMGYLVLHLVAVDGTWKQQEQILVKVLMVSECDW